METKKQIRNKILDIRSQMTLEVCNEKSALIIKHFVSTDYFIKARIIMLYADFRNEVSTKELFVISKEAGKMVCFPRISDEGMRFYYVEDLKDLVRSSYGILEPDVLEVADTVIIGSEVAGSVITGSVITSSEIVGSEIADSEITKSEKAGLEKANFELDERVCMIMPGAAFDIDFHRLGYGKGYYDRYLADNLNITKVAVAYDFQVLEQIPQDEFDIACDCIITEKRILVKCKR